MSGLIYPGIWGCLQPVVPRAEQVTSAIYPYEVQENLRINQPLLNSNSVMWVALYSTVATDMLHLSKPMISPASQMLDTIVYKTYTLPDTLTLSKPVISPLSHLDITIAYQTTIAVDAFQLSKPMITPASALLVTINYATTLVTDNFHLSKPMISAASSMS